MKDTALALSWCVLCLCGSQPAPAATPAGTVQIDPESRGVLITDWGYDIKNASAINGLTASKAQELFVDDRMSTLRVSIWGDSVMPAHPAPGEIDVSYYVYDATVTNSKKMFTAMKNARDARPDVRFFASKKSQSESMPAWTKNNGSLISANYARMLADYLRFWEHDLTRKSESFTFDILGINNEGAAFSKTEYAKHKEVIDELRILSQQAGTVDLVDTTHATDVHVIVPAAFTMPRLIIGPERWSPEPGEVSDLLAVPGAGNTLDLIGTHYYPERRYYSSMANMLVNGQGRPGWNSEVHWAGADNGLDNLQDAEITLATVFDNIDAGFSGYCWWAYSRTGFTGSFMRAITASTTLARSCAIDDEDGFASPEVTGSLVTRAFREGNSLRVWAMNVRNTALTNHAFKLTRGGINGAVTFQRWANVNGSFVTSSGTATANGTDTFNATLPANSITLFTLPYLPPGAEAIYPFAGDTLDASGAGNHGTPAGAVAYAAGHASQCLQLNGTNASVSIPRTISKEFTIAFWMRTVAPGPTGATAQWWRGSGLVDGEVNGSADDFGVSLYGQNVAFGVGKPDTTLLSTSAMADGKWRHVTATRNSITGEMELFIDGKPEARVAGPKGTKAAPPALRIGSLQTGSNPFNGQIDELHIYDRVIGPDEIRQLAFVAPSGSTILTGYDFDDKSGSATRGATVRNLHVTASDYGVGSGLNDLINTGNANCNLSLPDAEGNPFGTANGFDYGGTRDAFGFTDQNNADNLAGAIAANDYMTFTVTPAAGHQLDLSRFTFRSRVNNLNASAERWALFSSVGGFANGAQIASGQTTVESTFANHVVDLSSKPGLRNLTTPVAFRLYIYGGNEDSSSATLFDKVILHGTANAISVDPYQNWAANHALGGGFGDDDDHDGIANGMEFVLNGNPKVSNTTILPTAVRDATHLRISYTRTADSKTRTIQTVQWSTDLATWNDITVDPGAPDSVTIGIPLTHAVDGRLYARLKVALP